jgi:hypothetical protein
MDGASISPEEISQALTGPVHFALHWIQSVGHNQDEVVWEQMTPRFRLATVQAWLSMNPEALNDPSVGITTRGDLASELAQEKPTNALYRHLARVMLREIKGTFGNLDVDQFGPGLRPRLMGPGLEVVRLFYLPDLDKDEAGNYVFAAGATARGAAVWVEREAEGWAVAGVGDGILQPGWPPIYERILRPED